MIFRASVWSNFFITLIIEQPGVVDLHRVTLLFPSQHDTAFFTFLAFPTLF